jgi:hypothetical protein
VQEQKVRALQQRLAKEGYITPDMPPYYHGMQMIACMHAPATYADANRFAHL